MRLWEGVEKLAKSGASRADGARFQRLWRYKLTRCGGRSVLGLSVLAICGAFNVQALAQDVVNVEEVRLDPPTLVTLGLQLLVSGDANSDARVEVYYRGGDSTEFQQALNLWRVRPTLVAGRSVPRQFAGSIFDLRPATKYEIELHVIDPDGFDEVLPLTAKTRPMPPLEPAEPQIVEVATAAAFEAALAAAAPGTVIVLAPGTYTGRFVVEASGTQENPIFIRGADAETTILDGGGSDSGSVLEVAGSFTTIERLTLQNLDRALYFQGEASEGNVVRRVHIRDVRVGVGAEPDQRDFYLCDNTLEGRLAWPAVYDDDAGAHASDDGISVMGSGHVVCHNRLSGFGDALQIAQDGARAIDFYGNETLSAYASAIELSGAEGNVRAFRNRLTNSWTALGFQPIFGGPVYAVRNVAFNIAAEQQKLHARGASEETVGALLYYNTFVSPKRALSLQSSATAHEFELLGNLYFGPEKPEAGRSVEWGAPVDNPWVDYNGWFGDGEFNFEDAGNWPSFARMQAAGVFEAHGTLLSAATFASGLTAPADYTTQLEPPDVTLAEESLAIDRGLLLPNVTDGLRGAGPDLGAVEFGCPAPVYGVRPEGTDETTEAMGCPDGKDGAGGTSSSGGAAGEGSAGGTKGKGGKSGNAATDTNDGACACRAPRNAGVAPQGLLWVLGLWMWRRSRAHAPNSGTRCVVRSQKRLM